MLSEKTKVLIADDSSIMRTILVGSLDKIGIKNCDEAENGAKALDLILSNEYDIVFIDHNIPNISGLELAKKIAELKNCNTKMVAISGSLSDELMEEFKNAGVLAFIPKPFKYQNFEEAIKIINQVQ